jgi:hypothetical protein
MQHYKNKRNADLYIHAWSVIGTFDPWGRIVEDYTVCGASTFVCAECGLLIGVSGFEC